MKKPRCFFAYPSYPLSHSEIVEGAIKQINEGQVVSAKGWKETSVSGKFIIFEICSEINASDIFVSDLTNLNHNVLFELGYAIAKKKRTYIILDPSIERSKNDFDKFMLSTVGYSPYSNTADIVSAFYKNKPYEDIGATIYSRIEKSIVKRTRRQKTLFYIKSPIESEASIRLTRRISKSTIKQVIDDPQEVRMQPLSWYVEEIGNAFCVISHFLGNDQSGWKNHNAKTSFISGLAFGLGHHLLMFAHAPYESPIDYQELLNVHTTAIECETITDKWLKEKESEFSKISQERIDYGQALRAKSTLANINIGDYIAEQEHDQIPDYFVETAVYKAAHIGRNSLIIGRKGSGKSAILYKLQSTLSSDHRNHVLVIRPIGYELEGLIEMLRQSIPISEKGYLIESFWKFLVYTELANSMYRSLSQRPPYLALDNAEQDLMNLVTEYKDLVLEDFSIRLEYLVSRLKNLDKDATAAEHRIKISELLHDNIIGKFRGVLKQSFRTNNRVVVLIDNLDKNWKQGTDLEILSHLLLGLLSVSQRICEDFRNQNRKESPVDLSISIFLRSDIFGYIIKFARERDKIGYSRISWDDPLLLLRVIEERFMASTDISATEDVWNNFFTKTINTICIKDYLVQNIIPRPRDIIYVVKAALANAVNHNHSKIEEVDILEAQKKYSQYAVDSLLVENGISVEDFESLLYEFIGMPEIINEQSIKQAIVKAGLSEVKQKEIIDLLCERTFLGREANPDDFRFEYNPENTSKIEVMSRKTAESRPEKMTRFRINKAYHSYLEIRNLGTDRENVNLFTIPPT